MNKEQQLRELFTQGLNAIYTNLVTYINKLNLNPQLKSYAFMNLDQGIYWTQLGINSLQAENSEVVAPPMDIVSDANKTVEIDKEENKEIAA
jgi:hypothetical protein